MSVRVVPFLLRLAAMVLLIVLLSGDGGATESAVDGAVREVEQTAASDFDKAIHRAQALLDRYGYAVVFGVIFLEGIGIPAPGESLVIAAAIEASRGALSIAVLFVVTVAAAILGNSTGYAIGRFGGSRLLHRLPISADRLAHASQLFDRYGGWFILVARFIDGPRQLNGIIAGTLKMPWWEFSLWNVLGALLWVSVWGGMAYWLGHDIKSVLKTLQPLEHILLGTLAVLALAAIAYLVWRKRSARSGSPSS
ncbi:MAG: DedA family protein [Methyloceanibacter sp.]|nr:DedA family protein [Methyloceanibacter sp.]